MSLDQRQLCLSYLSAIGGLLLSGAAAASSVERFEAEIYPLLTNDKSSESCVSCHDVAGTSDLVFLGNAKQDFQMLLQQGYFKLEGPDSLLGRVTAENAKRRMPKKAQAWPEEDVAALRAFLTDLDQDAGLANGLTDEAFPVALLDQYEGAVPDTLDNQFISYRQLRGKIETVFGETWQRDGEDLFAANVAMFGGADFKQRFNESSRATSTFLTALDMMVRDVVSTAFTKHAGPFEHLPKTQHEVIDHLYQAILFRAPTEIEMNDARALLQRLGGEVDAIAERDYDLSFRLTVTDPSTGMAEQRTVCIPVSAGGQGVRQVLIDQNLPTGEDGPTALFQVPEPVTLRAGNQNQSLVLHNDGTIGNVSFAGVRLRRVDQEQDYVTIAADAGGVQPIGSWAREDRHGLTSLEDEGRDKGQSRIIVPLRVENDGDYHVSVCWRQKTGEARQVLVELLGIDDGRISLAQPHAAKVPPAGQVWFHYDSSEDARAFFAPEVAFRFMHGDVVEVSNADTDDRVTAGAIELVPLEGGDPILIDSREALGNEDWEPFKSSSFRAYNQKGTSLHDNDEAKGERFLRYRPCLKADAGWQPESTYRLRIYYAGKRGHETQVPVTVRAAASSPVIQLVYPPHGHADGRMVLDAGATYTAHEADLDYHWQQLEGPKVVYEASQPRLEFDLPRWRVVDFAWQAMARALLKHPDFLFTRPPSIREMADGLAKQRLQLLKMALDLAGRPPSSSEFDQLGSGASLADMADHYLASEDFEDFYHHRIRLYLESQGTVTHDEPARLWTYVAFHDRPFQEILTADYTVDDSFIKKPRPSHHGRTGVLTTKGFIDGKPGLPHYNYAAQVSMLFLGYVYEVPPEIVEQREGVTAAGTTDPQSACYSCHKILTPLAHQRNFWTDAGDYRTKTDEGVEIEASDLGMVEEYPFKGRGMEAFATQAVKKERFIRTIIDTHFHFYFGRQMRFRQDERVLYKRVWDALHADGFKIRTLIRTLVTSPEYLEGRPLSALSSQ